MPDQIPLTTDLGLAALRAHLTRDSGRNPNPCGVYWTLCGVTHGTGSCVYYRAPAAPVAVIGQLYTGRQYLCSGCERRYRELFTPASRFRPGQRVTGTYDDVGGTVLEPEWSSPWPSRGCTVLVDWDDGISDWEQENQLRLEEPDPLAEWETELLAPATEQSR